MPISSRKKIISFFYRKINSASKKTPGKKATTKTKNLTKKKKNYSKGICGKYTDKFIGQFRKTLCVFYREIKSESADKKTTAKKKIYQKEKN